MKSHQSMSKSVAVYAASALIAGLATVWTCPAQAVAREIISIANPNVEGAPSSQPSPTRPNISPSGSIKNPSQGN